MSVKQFKMKSILGPLYLNASDKGLQSILFEKNPNAINADLSDSDKASQILKQSVCELEEYFSKKREKFTVALDLVGTDFQLQVWRALLKIPYGKTCSYKEIGVKIKNEKAVRAIGGANGKNPICIIIPCHRVINADGGLGGYSGGLDKKIKLLAIESNKF